MADGDDDDDKMTLLSSSSKPNIIFVVVVSFCNEEWKKEKKQPYQKKFFLLYKFLVHFYCILFMLNEILKYHLIQPTYLSVCFSLDFIDNLKRRKEVGSSSATGEGGVSFLLKITFNNVFFLLDKQGNIIIGL